MGVIGLADLLDDGPADDIAGRQLRGFVVFGHEPLAVAIDQVRPFAADSFGDQRSTRPGDIERGRVKLDHLHVLQRRPGAEGHGMAVGGGDAGD